ncbi:MAG: hypothetical protein D9N11_10140 [Ketobacter sp.]|nr:MAG: hypothetical protein D9N11_10140 [Ketobacter sp.]
MYYELEVNAEEGYVRATATCDITRVIATQMTDGVFQMLRAENLEAGLIDVRNCRNVDAPSQNYQFANEDAAALKLRTTDRIAILAAPDDDSHDFVAIVMGNNGYNVHIFRDEEEALAWLKL